MPSNTNSPPFVTRFAPSPTGYLHFGNVRTALFNWLAAKSGGGEMQLRIEDTDRARNEQQYIDAVCEDLAWLRLDWRGDVNGKPWMQSQRQREYGRLFETLKSKDAIYPCFCTPTMLAAERKAQAAAHLPPRYGGKCAALATSVATARLAAGEEAAWRFKMPPDNNDYDDLVRGNIDAANIGDFVIRRANGDFSFLFVNAVDDVLCGVTCVLRGADHIANTPRQIALLRALEMPPPRYGHISLITNANGKPLSKRDGLTPLRDWRARGFLPAAVLNYLARAGHSYPPTQADTNSNALMSAEKLAQGFRLGALGRAAAQYDEKQLAHWQKEAVSRLDDAAIRQWLGGDVTDDVGDAFYQVVRENVVLPEDAAAWRRVFTTEQLPCQQEALELIAATPKKLFSAAAAHSDAAEWKIFTAAVREAGGASGKALIMPLRAALSGRLDGPGMSVLFSLVSPDRRRQRLLAAARTAAG